MIRSKSSSSLLLIISNTFEQLSEVYSRPSLLEETIEQSNCYRSGPTSEEER